MRGKTQRKTRLAITRHQITTKSQRQGLQGPQCHEEPESEQSENDQKICGSSWYTQWSAASNLLATREESAGKVNTNKHNASGMGSGRGVRKPRKFGFLAWKTSCIVQGRVCPCGRSQRVGRVCG